MLQMHLHLCMNVKTRVASPDKPPDPYMISTLTLLMSVIKRYPLIIIRTFDQATSGVDGHLVKT